jgi:DNA-binding NtrC family response regulator
VLIVSGDTAVQDTLVCRLRRGRVAAYGVSTVEDAAWLARHVPIPIFVVDVDRSEDWRALSQLRQQLDAKSAVIVFSASARHDRAHRILARRIGCAGFLAKPCSFTELLDVLDRAAAPRVEAATLIERVRHRGPTD